MANEVFISYSRKDIAKVREIKATIDGEVGIDCWMDLNGIESGEQFEDVIIDAICRHDTVLFMKSVQSMESEWALDELDFAKHEKKRIVIVHIDDSEMTRKFYFRYHKYDQIDWNDSLQRDKLIRNLKSWLPKVQEQKATPNDVYYDVLKQKRREEDTRSAVKEFFVDGVSFKMIRVEGGSFQMGSSDNDFNAYSNEKPRHKVTLSDYYIGETQVTQDLWKAVMGVNPSFFVGINNPVEQVSWYDCQEFIKKLNSKSGQQFRLPTEAEWEFAARGRKKSPGFEYSGSNNIYDVAWFAGNSTKRTHQVKGKKANELGLYDMNGNVAEWCQDWFGSYPSTVQANPLGPSSGSFRVLRGGSWNFSYQNCRVASRFISSPDIGANNIGFRLVLIQQY